MTDADGFARTIAVAGVAVSLWGLSYTQQQTALSRDQLKTTKEQFHEQLEQIKKQGPIMTTKAVLWAYSDDLEKRERVDEGQHVTAEMVEQSEIMLEIEVTNGGRFKGTVASLGVGTGELSYRSADEISCMDDDGNLDDCKLSSIEPLDRASFYISLENEEMREALTCSKHNEAGIQYTILYIGAQYTAKRIKNTIYYIFDCP